MLNTLQPPHSDQDQEILFLDPEYNLLDVQTLNLENRPAIEAHAGRLTAEYGPVVVAVRLELPVTSMQSAECRAQNEELKMQSAERRAQNEVETGFDLNFGDTKINGKLKIDNGKLKSDDDIPFLGEPVAPPESMHEWQTFGLSAMEVA